MTVTIEFSILEQGEFSPFDQGNIEIKTEKSIISSRSSPRWSFMIFIGISDFIHGLMLCHSGQKKHEFVGADSSFSLLMSKTKLGIEIKHEKLTISASWPEVFRSTSAAVSSLINEKQNEIDWNHAVFQDLRDARTELLRVMAKT